MKIINLGNTVYNNYLAVGEKHTVLIDFGNNTNFKTACKQIERAGVRLDSIDYAVLTHAHADHVSYPEDFLKATGATIICHETARAKLLDGHDTAYFYSSKANRQMSELFNRMRGGPAKWNPFDVDAYKHVYISGDLEIDELGAKIVTLDGHTADSIGVVFDGKQAVIGDAVMNFMPAKHLIPLLIEDGDEFRASYQKLIGLNADVYYPGHGKPFGVEKLACNVEYAENLHTF